MKEHDLKTKVLLVRAVTVLLLAVSGTTSIQRLNSRGLDEEGNKLKLGSELTNDDFWAR